MRRTIISTMCMAVALVLAASCNKIEENTPSVENDGRTVINGVAETIGTGTKADMAYCYEIIWREGDQIYVTDDKNYDTFTLASGEGTTKGQFKEDNEKGITGEIEAFYPASLKDGDAYVWPAVQANNQVAPMYAKQTITGAEGETVNFSSLGAMLQIVFTTPNKQYLTSITLQSNKKPLSGKFTVDENGQAIMDDNSENPGVTLDLGEGVLVGPSASYFYIAIPAGTYSTPKRDEKITITFNSSDGGVCRMSSSTFPDLARNTVGRITLNGSFGVVVNFDLNGHGTTGISSQIVPIGSKIYQPYYPTLDDEYFICGWYKDKDCTEKWNFDTDIVLGNMTLYAKWGTAINGHEYVELAGLYWATESVAESHGVQYGNFGPYYYDENFIVFDVEKWNEGNYSDKYQWQVPTAEHWQALMDECDITMPYELKISDKKDPSKFIILDNVGYITPDRSREVRATGYWAENGMHFHFTKDIDSGQVSYGLMGSSSGCLFALRLVIDPHSSEEE